MDALRKVYHRAVQIPLDNVERLWSELEAFETQLNRITVRPFLFPPAIPAQSMTG
jgi:cleavage stimulation factor subunit 3